jgi:hypothetical protein
MRFPLSMQEVPTTAVAYIASQIGVTAAEFSRYDWEGRAVKYHRAQIRAFLGFREPTVQDAEELGVWLSEHVLPQGHADEHVNAAAYQRLRDLGIEPPTRLLLCLYGLGTNTGLKRVSSGAGAESYPDLVYVRRRFIRKEPYASN